MVIRTLDTLMQATCIKCDSQYDTELNPEKCPFCNPAITLAQWDCTTCGQRNKAGMTKCRYCKKGVHQELIFYVHDDSKEPQKPSPEWSWLYNFDTEGVQKTSNNTVWKVNLDEDKYHWAEMETYCMEEFEKNYEPNTLMEPLVITFDINDKETKFLFNLNEMKGQIAGKDSYSILIKREPFIQNE